MKLLAVEDARARMLAEITALPAESLPLANAIGRVLAEDITAARDQPPFDASAMDGWAVRSGGTPGVLQIIGESAAGRGFDGPLGAGETVRIFTGAAVPAGADAVLIQEDAQREGETLSAPATPAGQHLRARGRDFAAGDVLLRAGQRIDPWRLSLAASAGRSAVSVHGTPRVAILSTGEEIIEAPGVPGPFQIYDSGAPALLAMVRDWGGEAVKLKPVRDNLDAVVAALQEADADLVVTIGGASVGDHDLVRAAAEALGLSMKVASVAVRPGKPTFFGILGDGRRLLGLPGNPASAFVCAELFLRPILRAYQGDPAPFTTIPACAAIPLSANGPREHWMRAKISLKDGLMSVHPYGDQDSSLVTVFAGADALLRRPPGAAAVDAGGLVEVLLLDRA